MVMRASVSRMGELIGELREDVDAGLHYVMDERGVVVQRWCSKSDAGQETGVRTQGYTRLRGDELDSGVVNGTQGW